MAPPNQPATAGSDVTFTSLAELRARHSALLRTVPSDGLDDTQLNMVHEFLQRGAAIGSILDQLADRDTAQGLLDYWKASLYTDMRFKQSSSKRVDDLAEKARLPATVLADFDPATLQVAVENADRWLSTLSDDDQTLVRRIMLRLARLGPDNQKFELVPNSRAALYDVGSTPAKVDELIAGLVNSGVVRINKGNSLEADQVSLRANEMTTGWRNYAGWLAERVKFRELAESWDPNKRLSTGLLKGQELWEVRNYHDRNSAERVFIEQSWYRQQEKSELDSKLKLYYLALAGLASICLIAVLYYNARANRAERAKDYVQESNRKALEVRATSDRTYTFALIHLLTKENVSHSHHAAKKLLIIQTLAQLVSSDQSAWEDVKTNWVKLEDNLNQDSLNNYWFKTVFFPKKIGDQTIQERINLFTRDWESARANKRELPQIAKFLGRFIYNELQDMPDIKARWYNQAIVIASELYAAAQSGKTLTEVSGFKDAFWRLYLGEMVLVESEGVEKRMIEFGNLLTEWETSENLSGKASSALQDRMKVALEELGKACDADLKELPSNH